MTEASLRDQPTHETSELRVEVVTDLRESFVAEWATFAKERVLVKRLAYEPGFSQAEFALHPERPPYLVVVRRRGKIVAMAVGARSRSPLIFSVSVIQIRKFRAWKLKVFGNDFAYDRDEDPKVLARAIFEELATRGNEVEVLTFDELFDDSVLYDLFKKGEARVFGFSLEPTTAAPDVAHHAALPKTFDALLLQIPGDKRGRVRRLLRDAKATGLVLEEFKTGDSVARFLKFVEEIYPRTWQGRTFGPRVRNARHLEILADHGWLRGFVLFEKEKAIAFVLGFQYDGTYIYEEPGYDSEATAKSPGFTLLSMLLEHVFKENPPTVFDFGFGDNQYKRVFSTEQVAVRAAVAVHTPFLRALFRGQRVVTRVYDDVRKEVIRRGYDQKVRDFLKHR